MAFYITEDCGGCTVCARFCPVMAISGAPKQQHVINAKRCVECGVCGRACTKNAVVDAAGLSIQRIPRVQWPKPLIDKALCSACSICVSVCTAGALEISRPQFQGDLQVAAQLVNEKKCVGCGLCAKQCPLAAITMTEGGNA